MGKPAGRRIPLCHRNASRKHLKRTGRDEGGIEMWMFKAKTRALVDSLSIADRVAGVARAKNATAVARSAR
jgi:hypothetical protein